MTTAWGSGKIGSEAGSFSKGREKNGGGGMSKSSSSIKDLVEILLVPKLPLGNWVFEAPASLRTAKQELAR